MSIPTAWVRAPLAAVIAVAAVEKLLRRRTERAWAAVVAAEIRLREARAAETAMLDALYAAESAEEPS